MSKFWDDPELNLNPVIFNSDKELMLSIFRQKKYALKVLVHYWTKVTLSLSPKFKKYCTSKYQLLQKHYNQINQLLISLRSLQDKFPHGHTRRRLLKIIVKSDIFINHYYISFKYSFDDFP